MVGRLGQDDLDLVAQGPPGARWLLVEAPFERIGADFHAATDELRDRGFGWWSLTPSGAPTRRSTPRPVCAARSPSARRRS